MPVHIHDLGVGGCLIQSYHEVAAGRRMTIDIELPYEGWITVLAEARYSRDDYGFAVEFIEVPPETQLRLERVIRLLLTKAPGAE